MGMYDEITCAMELPDKPDFIRENHVFQTKSLGCELTMYLLDENGELMELIDQGLHSMSNFNGDVFFYDSNCRECTALRGCMIVKLPQ